MADSSPTVSLQVMARPGEFNCVREQILNIDGTEIQSVSEEGRLLVRVAASNSDELNRRVDILQFVEGVQSSTLSYH